MPYYIRHCRLPRCKYLSEICRSAFGAAVFVNRTTTGATTLSGGAGFNVPGSFVNNSAITIANGAHNITADGPTPWQIASIYLLADGATINVNRDATFGSINNVNGNGAGIQKVNFVIADGVAVTLTGAGITQAAAAGALDAPGGAASPFANGLAVPADTYYINNINFGGTAGVLNISDPTITNIIKLDASTFSTELAGAGAATLNVNSSLQVRDVTWSTLKTINIANGATYNYISNAAGDIDVQPTVNQLIFKGANSTVNFSNENPGSTKFTATQDIVSGADNVGIVGFHVSSSETEVAANVGANGQRLQTFITDGLSKTTITGNIFAKKIQIAQNPQNLANQVQLIWTTEIDTGAGGLVQFTTNSISQFQAKITSNMDFNGTGATAILNGGVNVGVVGGNGGNIDNSKAGGNSTLNFAGSAIVTGNIGATNPIAILNVQGNNTTVVDLGGNVTVNALNYTSTGITTVGGTLTATTGVNYNNNAAALAFVNPVGSYTFSSPILQATNGSVMVDTILTATHPSIATAKTILIGATVPASVLTLAVNNTNLNLLPGGNGVNDIIFDNAGAALTLASPVVQTVTFGGNLDGFAGGGGNVTLNGTKALTIAGGSFGANNALGSVSTIGTVQAQGAINFKGITTLNVTGNSNFTDQTVTSAGSTNINIGGGGVGTYILTPNNVDFDLATLNMKFNDPNSVLNIQSTGNVMAMMNGDLDPGAAASGIISLTSTLINANDTLTLTGANNLGINGGNTLNSITFAGDGNITVTPTINTANAISTGITGNLILSNVNAGINFTAATNLTVNNVTGNVDFKGQATGTLNLTANSTITGKVDSTIVGVGGKLNLAAGTTVTGVIGGTNPLTAVNFNGADINLTATSNANLFTISGGATATAGGLMTGAVNYAGGRYVNRTKWY